MPVHPQGDHNPANPTCECAGCCDRAAFPPGLGLALGTPVTTPAGAIAYLGDLLRLGAAYHPDDSAADIVGAHSGLALFTPAEAVLAEARMAEVRALLADPCEVLLGLMAIADTRPLPERRVDTVCPGCDQEISVTGSKSECGGEGEGICDEAAFAFDVQLKGLAYAQNMWAAKSPPPTDAECKAITLAHNTSRLYAASDALDAAARGGS